MKWNWKEFWTMRKWKPTQPASALDTHIIWIAKPFWPADHCRSPEIVIYFSFDFHSPPVPAYWSVLVWVLTVNWRLTNRFVKLASNYVSNHSTHYACFNDAIGLVYTCHNKHFSSFQPINSIFSISFSNNRILLNLVPVTLIK